MVTMEPSGFSDKLIAFFATFDGVTAYSLILGVLFACGLGLPLPEDITLVAAGILAAMGKISLAGALIAGMVGVLIGDAFLFLIGRKLGHRAFRLPLFRRVFTENRIRIAESKVVENSKFICFTARFLPGLRAPIYLTCGIMGVRPMVFFLLDGIAALISVPFWVVAGWWFGQVSWDEAKSFIHRSQLSIILGVVILVSIYIVIARRRRTK